MKKVKAILLICIFILFAVIAVVLANNMLSFETKYAKKLNFNNEEQLLAVAFLGGLEGEYDYSAINKYYTESEISKFKIIETDGEELYLVVPRYNNNVVISSLTMTEDGGTISRVVEEISEPFFLKCNISDIFPNAEIKFMNNKKEYKYSPYISLKDGSVVTEAFVMLIEK